MLKQPMCVESVRITIEDPDVSEVNFPSGGRIVGVQPSNVEAMPYATVLVLAERGAPREQRTFYATRYAVRLDLTDRVEYIGSCVNPGEAGMLHVFEVNEPEERKAA